ncbi:MAG: hypothetical protein HUJ63_03860, partial [Enterococcus sp.]|nr:hypothetical protein [Enterococcus sp.]
GFKNINLDLMFALPEQSERDVMESFEVAIKLAPEHISFYGLQIEDNTPFYGKYKRDALDFWSYTDERRIYFFGRKFLKENGYESYEISNFAKDGFYSRHNLKYWSMDEYVGVGLGASSFIDGYRFENSRELKEYNESSNLIEFLRARDYVKRAVESKDIAENKSLNATIFKRETVRELMGEFIFTGLRKSEGISLKKFEEKFEIALEKAFPFIKRLIKSEKLIIYKQDGEEFIKINEQFIYESNDIMCEFV